uniref:DUF4460 domain-containing protein n=1 Tax=Anas zonorhyncha TaxID=75864 RepID=A0A8B9UYR6_9AVES
MFTPFCHILMLCLEKILLQCIIQSRTLSGADAINALRPFYFAVHPDFFGQHPKERGPCFADNMWYSISGCL